MNPNVIITLLGGLGLFLFGIKLMEDGLKQLAGDYLKRLMSALTKNRLIALVVGFILTTLVQSSSATSVMIVGFINAGFVTLTQSIGFILGCNIGSTTTGQLMSFKLDQYALLILGIGAIAYLFLSKEKLKNAGLALLGLGMLFFGMNVMKDGIHPLRESGQIEHWFSLCSADSISSVGLGVLIGTLTTAIVQSSGATVGIIIALGAAGVVKEFTDVVPLILGCNIGTCITALLASLRVSTTAKKAAIVHTLFNVIGAILILSTYHFWIWLIPQTSDSITRQIANGHTLFKVAECIVFLPFAVTIVKLLDYLWPEQQETMIDLLQYRSFAKSEYLSKGHLGTPSFALIQVQKEIGVMTQITAEMIEDVRTLLFNFDPELILRVERHEDVIDEIKRDLHDYIVLLAQSDLTSKQAFEAKTALEAAADVERVADHIESMLKYVQLAHERVIVFDQNNKSRIIGALDKAVQLADLVYKHSNNRDQEKINEIVETNQKLLRSLRTARQYYDKCLRSGSWNLFSDLSLLELVTAIERYSRHYKGFVDKYLKQSSKLKSTTE